MCVYTPTPIRTYLPPHVHFYLPPNILTYLNTCFSPFLRNLGFPYVFSYVYVNVCMSVPTCKFITYLYPVRVCVVCVCFFPTWLYICVLRTAWFVFCSMLMTTFVFEKIRYVSMSRCPLQYIQPSPCSIFLFPASSFVYVAFICIQTVLRTYLPPHVHLCSPAHLPQYLHSHERIFTLTCTFISPYSHTFMSGIYIPKLICTYLPILATIRI